VLIYVITEHYPSLFKPYFDTQFEQFAREGHEVRVFAFAPGEQLLGTATDTLARIHRETRFLPAGRASLPRFSPLIAAHLLASPVRRLAAVRRARRAAPPRVANLTDFARLAAMPVAAPDLVLVHNLLAARWVRFLRDLYPDTPVAFYYHGGELPGVPEVPASEAAHAFAAADIVFTNTEKSRHHAVTRGCPPEKVVVSPVGFNLEEFPRPHGRGYRRGGRLNLLSIGRLSPEKGFNYAIEAARQLVSQGFRDFHYKIVGGGALEEALRRQVETAQLEAFVELSGPAPRADVVRATYEADVLILPSIVVGTWEENQACVVQEAMLAQCLVIATKTGGVPESLAPELRPFLVPEGDAPAIAAAVLELHRRAPAELARLGEAGRRFAEDRYDIRKQNGQILRETMSCRTASPGAGA